MNEKIINTDIKHLNRKTIFNLLFENKDLSKQDLVLKTHLSLPTITQNLNALESEGLIYMSGAVGNTGGRKARTYSVVPTARIAVGLCIRQHHITSVVIDLFGNTLSQQRIPIHFEKSDSYFKMLADIVEDAITLANIDRSQILGVGICLPGMVNKDNNYVYYCKVIDLMGTHLEEIAKYIPYKATLIHDIDAYGLAESFLGIHLDDVFILAVTETVGGVFIHNGTVYKGKNDRASEIGHIRIVPHGQKCYCGGEGCADPYLSTNNLANTCAGNLESFFKLLNTCHSEIQDVWQDYCFYLATTIVNAHVLVDCPIIIGGDLGRYMNESQLVQCRGLVAKMDPFDDACDYVHLCSYKNEGTSAASVGGALHYIIPFLNSI